jgi:uncharacterized membrane protein YccC
MGERAASQRFARALRGLHWTRGLRAGVAVAGAMIVCHLFSKPIGWAAGWAALGGFEAILVDNGGPYRSRFNTITTLLVGGSLGCVAAAFAFGAGPGTSLPASVLVTAAFCFAATLGRVIAQPVASTSVIILVIYFAAWGSGTHSIKLALWHALAFALGGIWAGVLSLLLWPVDPFRPARRAVSLCYESLAEFTAGIAPTERGSAERELARRAAFEWQRRMRSQMELARTALAGTAARAPSRTVRARNLTVLLETADMLLAATMRTTELALGIDVPPATGIARKEAELLGAFTSWLSEAEGAIAANLQRKPDGEVAICSPRGPEETRRTAEQASGFGETGSSAWELLAHLAASEADARQNVEIACEAVKALWSGVDRRGGSAVPDVKLPSPAAPVLGHWIDAVRSNWTLDSVMMRHALRMTVVGAADVVLLRMLHLSHGFWLGMTSIIVLQAYPSHTLKRSMERVGGTIAGGILAAILAAAISSQAGIIAVVTATSVLTLATYAVDYAWYCFFLTPTFVLLSLPHLRDWKYSGVRMLTTLLGAAVAVVAMRTLWPEREHLALGKLLARAAAADAAYIRATLRFWETLQWTAVNPPSAAIERRRQAEREILAPARRAGGLASNDAEESLDRLMQEPGLGQLMAAKRAQDVSARMKEHALTFLTYSRRLRQSVTTLAALGTSDPETIATLERYAERLDGMSEALRKGHPLNGFRQEQELFSLPAGPEIAMSDIASHQLQRTQRQVAILERAAAGLLGASAEPA